MSDMSEISTSLIESLKTMGLTEYEAKIYSALVLFERAEVKRIYEFLNMPKPSVYQSLKGLMDKGLVMMVNSKPAIYRAIPPEIALRHLTENYKNAEESALDELEKLEKNNLEIENSEIIWTLFGNNNVEHSMEELILKAKISMKLILPDEYLDFLSFVKDKNIEISLLTFGNKPDLAQKYGLNNLNVHNIDDLDVSNFGIISKYFMDFPIPANQVSNLIMVSVDNEDFMYIPPFSGQKSGVTSQNSHFISLLNIIFSIIWDHTTPE